MEKDSPRRHEGHEDERLEGVNCGWASPKVVARKTEVIQTILSVVSFVFLVASWRIF